MNYQETSNECLGCGSTGAERKFNKPNEPQGISQCPNCGANKCCMCDMGDDVECGNCEDEG